MTAPRISVLIATADRPELLEDCLRCLRASTFQDAEVLVLDQSRAPVPPPALNDSDGGPRVRHVLCPRRGKSAALNVGISLARGSLLAFTDDDCRVAPDWLEVMAVALEQGERLVLTGRVLAGETEGETAAAAPSLRDDAAERIYRQPASRDVLFGNNMAIPAEILRRVGPFDEALGPGTPAPAAEDNDLGYRLLKAGIPIRYLPAMVVVHRSWRGEREQVGLYLGYGLGQGAFYRKHLARRDLHMLSRMARSLWSAGRDAGGAVLLGRPYDFRASTAFASGLLKGFLRGAPGVAGRGNGAMPGEGR
ncbi:MAG TPA: glycosyltransferase family A protein [Candidatus Polarisedimenticolia bacterium]|jgi:GT2 family glycosyltransferase|nr:glycosyltransferase family A protein [Candidatus Polarisedimenticolia bacterium]